MVSMPSIGLIPFLHYSHFEHSRTHDSVSMPSIGLIPFLLRIRKRYQNLYSCVNALYRAHPISTANTAIKPTNKEMCQCPLSGSSHFYRYYLIEDFNDLLCQCPLSGSSHFYHLQTTTSGLKKLSVNALYRAHPISTVSSEKPYKYKALIRMVARNQ